MIKTIHDIIRFMKRFPDKITTSKQTSERMTAKIWKCSSCETMYHSEIGRTIPSPCRMCGEIGFEKFR
jgi:ribosomal protein L37AE/L43A